MILGHVCTICSHVQSDDEDKEPTRNLAKDTPSQGEETEQGSYTNTMDEDVSDYCFEHEQFPCLKITKVETLDSEVNQSMMIHVWDSCVIIIFIQKCLEGVTKLEVIDNDMELDDIKEEKYFEFLGADEDLDIDDKEQLQITLQNTFF